MELAAVWPVLLRVQLLVAGVGETVGVVLEQPDRLSAGGVRGGGFTTKLIAVDAPVPVLGVALSVPL
jgi:hypothetical protein